VKSIFIDIAFVSATGFLPTEGTFESAPATFRIKQEVARQASELVLLADHGKFGRRALSKVLDITQISHVVTDDQVSAEHVAILREAGIKVTVAPRSQDTFGRGS
jgi:DeoR/GlpR family transcriptional regulator of sugar metabolism